MKSIIHIHLSQRPISWGYLTDNSLATDNLGHQRKCLIIVQFFLLIVPISHQPASNLSTSPLVLLFCNWTLYRDSFFYACIGTTYSYGHKDGLSLLDDSLSSATTSPVWSERKSPACATSGPIALPLETVEKAFQCQFQQWYPI